jgi:probable F420-dependent oxidoreductase
MRGMHFGFALPGRGPLATPESLTKLAQKADGLRYSSLFVTDHVVIPTTYDSPYPYAPSGRFAGDWTNGYLEPLALMGVLAGLTSRVKLGTSVLVVPYRNPVVTAKMLATIDVLSGGRVTVGVGVGWMREEFEALGAPDFDRRGAASDEYIRIFKALWTQDPASHHGEFYRFDAIRCLPHPVQEPHPPIWIGGHSKAALRRVARLGDGWHPVGANPAAPLRPPEMRALLDDLHRLTEAEGRDPTRLAISYKAPIYDAGQGVDGGTERRLFSGSPQAIADDIGAFAALGVGELIFDFRSESLAESLDRMARFAPLIKA